MGLEERLHQEADPGTRDKQEDTQHQLSQLEAWQIVGGLSRTTKMPCHSWGLPATACFSGSRLTGVANSVCHGCYARKGNYTWPRVAKANERRLAQADHPDWTTAMMHLVEWQARKNEQPFFRWFDTGDLQSRAMLERIVQVAAGTPKVQHWLPTKEHELVQSHLNDHRIPDNLTIRTSAHFVDRASADRSGLPTSTVHSNLPAHGYRCTAYDERPFTCGHCRRCWDQTIKNVSYPHH